jgi:DNA polymerase III alpha subunit
MPDIDIDFYDRDSALAVVKHIPASRLENGEYKKHNTGVYLNAIPVDPVSNFASIDYVTAEQRGYFKIDFLNVSIYKDIASEQDIDRLLSVEPLWDLLEQEDFCNLIFHINGYHNLIKSLKPRSIDELSMFLAILRPGKKHLISQCEEKGWDNVKDEIWEKTDGEYSFKKSHAVAYAHAIVVQMNSVCEKVSYGFS